MKFKVYNEELVKEEVTLRLVKEGSDVIVVACDDLGNLLVCGNLITFNCDGIITKHVGINEDLGFQLDANEEILERGNNEN